MSATKRTTAPAAHAHRFVEQYDGLVGFGLDRKTDEHTLIYYLQKVSDDALAKTLVERMSDEELEQRRAGWKAPPIKYKTGVLAKYAKLVSSASKGAVTD